MCYSAGPGRYHKTIIRFRQVLLVFVKKNSQSYSVMAWINV